MYVGHTFMVLALILQLVAIYKFSDSNLIITTRITQILAIINGVLRQGMVSNLDMSICPAETGAYHSPHIAQLCNTTAADMSPFHASARGTACMYQSLVVVPIVFFIHFIPVRVIVPVCAVLGISNIYVMFSYVPVDMIFQSVLYPCLCFFGISLCLYRSKCFLLNIWQERIDNAKEKDAVMATVAHNLGTPLTSISFTTSSMSDNMIQKMNIESIKPFLKQQRIAIDYMRTVYTTVLYTNQKGGKSPTFQHQRFDIKELMNACRDMTNTYGSSLFPDIKIQYTISDELPQYIVSDWSKIQQCVVNLVSNGQRHTQKNDSSVNVHFLKDQNNGKNLRIEVSDNGNGIIDTDSIPIYFKKSGTGLGSVGLLIKGMNGKYGGYNSKDNDGNVTGCTFYIIIPCDSIDIKSLHDDDHAEHQLEHRDLHFNAKSERMEKWLVDSEPVKPEKNVVKKSTVEIECVEMKQNTNISDASGIETTEIETTETADETNDGNGGDSTKQFRILLVEDVDINRAFILLWLNNKFPFLTIVEASNGVEALELLETEDIFDVVSFFTLIQNRF